MSVMDESSGASLTAYVSAVFAAMPKILIAMGTSAILMSLWLNFLAVPEYTAHMVVAPYSENGADRSATAGASVLAMLAAGTGIGGANFSIYIQTRSSIPIAQRLQRDPDVNAHFFPSQWDTQYNRWRKPEGGLASVIALVKEGLGYPTWSPPDASALSDILDTRIKMAQDLQRGSYTFTFTDRDPVFAASLLRRIHEYSEERLRSQVLQRTNLQISHLIAELGQNSIAENRQVLTQILLQQQQQRSRINPAIPFAAQVVDPPDAGHKPSFPRPLLFMVVAIFLPLLVGVGLALLPVINPELNMRSFSLAGWSQNRQRRLFSAFEGRDY